MKTEKLNFNALLEENDNVLHNSNMQNLVSATRKIDGEMKELNKRILFLENLKAEILAFATTGDMQDTQTVKELFDKQSDEPLGRNRNW